MGTRMSSVSILRIQGSVSLTCIEAFNRLDRLTSGVLIVPRNPLTAKEFGQWMEADLIKKTYLARVMGDFPLYYELISTLPTLTFGIVIQSP